MLETCKKVESNHYERLSSLGVRVLDSEEVERNVLDQAASLSAKESPEFKKRTRSFALSLFSDFSMYLFFAENQYCQSEEAASTIQESGSGCRSNRTNHVFVSGRSEVLRVQAARAVEHPPEARGEAAKATSHSRRSFPVEMNLLRSQTDRKRQESLLEESLG